MVETKSDDKRNWGETGSFRVYGNMWRETENLGETVGDPYRLVYPQEPLWVLDLRLVTTDGHVADVIRVVLRPEPGRDWWPGEITFHRWGD